MHTHRDAESHRRGNMTLQCCSPESSSYLGKQLLAHLSVQGNYQHGSFCAPLPGQVLHFCAAADGARLAKKVCPLMDAMTRNRLMDVSSMDCSTVGRRNDT